MADIEPKQSVYLSSAPLRRRIRKEQDRYKKQGLNVSISSIIHKQLLKSYGLKHDDAII